MRWIIRLVLGVILFIPVRAEDLTVSAAISLKEVLENLVSPFEQANPGTKVRLNLGASGALAQQIRQGAPVDVLISAGPMDDLKEFLRADTLRPVAQNRLVLIIPTGKPWIKKLQDLSQVQRLAIGNPQTVPVGVYARQALLKVGIWDQLQNDQKLVLADNTRQVLSYVAGGNVDAGIVYVTDARTSNQVMITLAIPTVMSGAIIYPAGVIKDSPRPELARRFLDLLSGATGQKILQKQGFLLP